MGDTKGKREWREGKEGKKRKRGKRNGRDGEIEFMGRFYFKVGFPGGGAGHF